MLLLRIALPLLYFLVPHSAQEYAPYQDLYCGDMNCYHLLGVSRDAEKALISKAYRKLAGKWHPDRFRTPEEKKEAEQMFMRIASGYEVLKDDETRKEYDYMLDHPEETYGNYYRYYKRRMAPKIDVRIVLLALVTVVSAVQYYSAWYNFEQTINHLATVPKYRYQALEIAKNQGLIKDKPEKVKGVTKDEMRKREEEIVRGVIADMMDKNGGYQRPELEQILWLQIVRFPNTVYKFVKFNIDWIWRFYILRNEYGSRETDYLTRRNLGLSERQWDAVGEDEKLVYSSRKLWEREAWRVWSEEKAEEERVRNAMSGRSKQERRWEKKGDNRMTFDENYDW